jgi:streptogramin lyase
MLRKLLISLMITVAVAVGARPQTVPGRGAQTLRAEGGKITEFPLPNPGSGPTTISIAPDGTLWFTESAGKRIGRMAR